MCSAGLSNFSAIIERLEFFGNSQIDKQVLTSIGNGQTTSVVGTQLQTIASSVSDRSASQKVAFA